MQLVLETRCNDKEAKSLPRIPTPLASIVLRDGRQITAASPRYNLRSQQLQASRGVTTGFLSLPVEIRLIIFEYAYGHQDVHVERKRHRDGNRYRYHTCSYPHSIERVWAASTEGAESQNPTEYRDPFLRSAPNAGIHTTSHQGCNTRQWFGASPAINRELWSESFEATRKGTIFIFDDAETLNDFLLDTETTFPSFVEQLALVGANGFTTRAMEWMRPINTYTVGALPRLRRVYLFELKNRYWWLRRDSNGHLPDPKLVSLRKMWTGLGPWDHVRVQMARALQTHPLISKSGDIRSFVQQSQDPSGHRRETVAARRHLEAAMQQWATRSEQVAGRFSERLGQKARKDRELSDSKILEVECLVYASMGDS